MSIINPNKVPRLLVDDLYLTDNSKWVRRMGRVFNINEGNFIWFGKW